jgi:predicted Zn-dependent protease
MLNEIIAALKSRTELQGWTVRQIVSRGAQLYAIPDGVEARRSVSSERYLVDVLRQTASPDGNPASGSANATLLPGDDISKALDTVTIMAGLVHNPPYTPPAPAPLPDVPLADSTIQRDTATTLDGLLERLRSAVAAESGVRLNAAELFGDELTVHLCNSRGIDASQTMTQLAMEWVLTARDGEREVESFVETTRRRVADLDIEGDVTRNAEYTRDLLSAVAPSAYSGAVVMRGETLATFVNSGVLQNLSSAASKFSKMTTWETGKPVFRTPVTGDPLTVWATRRLPYGTGSDVFDEEGLPAQRVALITKNVLTAFTANQRYARYTSVPATGAFGNLELAPGATPAAPLLDEPHVEIVAFSWFEPNLVTGEFASEIRLGYTVAGGKRTPFKGGMLVGNFLDALADVRWSSETGFYGGYQGPQAARFGKLSVAGS